MRFYAVIIGSEILNGRREDKHFVFLRNELKKYGHELFASFVIKDDKELIERTFRFIKEDSQAVMFSFGGIGSTPDDLTREIAAKVFRALPLVRHVKFEQDIIERFKEQAYPHRIHMSDLPSEAELLFNPINNMSGFSLDERFFFTPGFPEMAHPMIRDVIAKFFSHAKKRYRFTLLAHTSENTLIDVMHTIPTHIELSSLPMFKDSAAMVEISLSGEDLTSVQEHFKRFIDALENKKITYKLM